MDNHIKKAKDELTTLKKLLEKDNKETDFIQSDFKEIFEKLKNIEEYVKEIKNNNIKTVLYIIKKEDRYKDFTILEKPIKFKDLFKDVDFDVVQLHSTQVYELKNGEKNIVGFSDCSQRLKSCGSIGAMLLTPALLLSSKYKY